MDTSEGSLELCLGVVKRFLLCSVCLDDFQNPVITPCSHIFCKFCIYEHLGKKRQANCPLCMKAFTRRSLKHSAKINEITNACRELITAYEEESGDTLRPSNIPDDFLHLSQELTQRPLTSRMGIHDYHSNLGVRQKNSVTNTAVSECIRIRGSTKSSKILLGTSARARRSQQKTETDDSLLTQPMTLDLTEANQSLPNQDAPTKDEGNVDLLDLFLPTQPTQPMEFDCDSAPFMDICHGASTNDKYGKNSITLRRIKNPQPDSAFNTRHKGIRTVPSRPPLPPGAHLVVNPSQSQRNSKNVPTVNATGFFGKRNSDASIQDRPRKQTRRESSHSTLSSAHGVLTKTHEIFCQINSTNNQKGGAMSETAARSRTESPESISLKRLPSMTSVRSWPLKRSRTQISNDARNILLQKYNLSRISTISRKSLRVHSVNSPGWSRWRTMCRELKQRGSALSLSFSTGRKPKHPTDVNSKQLSGKYGLKRSTTASNVNRSELKTTGASSMSFLNRISGSMLRRSKRGHRKLGEAKSLVPETQNFPNATPGGSVDTYIVGETQFSPNEQSGLPSKLVSKPCQFVLPLRRLVPRAFVPSYSSHNPPTPDQLCSKPHCAVAAKRLSLPIPCGQGADLMVAVNLSDTSKLSFDEKQLFVHSPTSNQNYGHMHCSACGETLFLPPSNLSTPCDSSNHTALRDMPPLSTNDLSCSISSTYWQAEDPGDSALSGLHTDHLVSLNRTAAASVSLFSEVGCQTSFDALGQSDPHTDSVSIVHTTQNSQCQNGAYRAVPEKTDAQIRNSNESHKDPIYPGETSDGPRPPVPTLRVSTAVSDAENSTSTGVTTDPMDPKLALNKADSFESPDTSLATSTFHTCSADIIPTVDRERLQNECNELEAVVAALQQQLEAQAAELSPKATEELLRTAGTEPCEEDLEVYSRIVDKEEPTKALRNEGDPCVSSQPNIILDASPETVDVIPSSQADEEMENIAKSPENKENLPRESESTACNTTVIPRVEASQPPSSSTAAICDMIPASIATASSQQTFKSPDLRINLPRAPKTHTLSTELTECPETDLDGLSYRVEELSSPCPAQDPPRSKVPLATLAITGSNLSGTGLSLLQRFCRHFGVTQHSRFIPRQTTHIVMREEPDRPRVVKRTLKYFVGILNRAWIVNTQWLIDSIEAGLILDETPYEIEGDTVCGDRHEGPRRGRLNVPAQPHLVEPSRMGPPSDGDQRPFAGLWLCAFGGLGLLNLSDFMSLAVDGGASRVFEKPTDLTLAVDTYMKTESARASTTRRPRAMILTNHNPPDFSASKCQDLYRTHGIPVISIDWMLNCISLYRRIPISPQYRICPSAPSHPQVPLTVRNDKR